MDMFGDEGYEPEICGNPPTPFLIEVESEYFRTLKFRYPHHWTRHTILEPDIYELSGSVPLPEKDTRVVYVHLGVDREVLYVGQTRDFIERQKQHRKNSIWWDEIASIEFISPVESSNSVEKACIQILKPRYNIAHNGGHRE
jgi:hypothetical protein